MGQRERDPDHPVLPEEWKHEVVGFHYERLAEEPFLDLVLRHVETKTIRRLRFLSPRDIRIEGPCMNWRASEWRSTASRTAQLLRRSPRARSST